MAPSVPLLVLRNPEYRRFITARFFYIMAIRTVTAVVGWRIYELTRDPFAIGLLGLSEFLPAFSLALYAGHIIDKSDKRVLILRTTLFYLVCTAALLSVSTSYANTHVSKPSIQLLIYLIIFCTGVVRAFAGPAFNAIVAQIVPRDQLANAVTLNSSTFLLASVLGHATAGFLIAQTHYVTTFTIVAGYLCVSLYFIFHLSAKPTLLNHHDKKTVESILEGLRFVFKTRRSWERWPLTYLLCYSAVPWR